MDWTENIFQEFVDALQTAMDENEFERIATRACHGLGFRWFAYLSIVDSSLKLISSYPRSWTNRYLRLQYQRLDPVVLRARTEHAMFTWGASSGSIRPRDRQQLRFFDEAMRFGIKAGITVPIRAGFGRMAAFTVATDDSLMEQGHLLATSQDVVQLLGLYFHTHLRGRLAMNEDPQRVQVLSQRERQCLAWAALGKTVSETAEILAITARTVAFHLENARRKLGAASIAHCVALAIRQRLLP
ncbi:autoinducer binding domain-containing protein [Bradyrhizobium stylosanthis]|uniref:LuxR family transcriptional activator of conjugal transfer of Ti plasmids n=1 Tax=Bradyrhizobium stylosanthis TaxID=1803665 RepID=A0A560E2Q9_9BRAD|nr:autoinducer binding domain-containing protein [Bradyrhizobium stylosanthis]TWB03666.1 LuxR family transcriptional activator of conjugal transfer of Ti plasmids [Bradyrhizobium stylosanthis]